MPGTDRKLTMDELERIGPETYRSMDKEPVWIILDDVRSRHNVGSIFRTADAFAVQGIALCGFTPLPPHREIEKTALGATLSVPWKHFTNTLEAIAWLRAEGHGIWAVEQTLHALPLDKWESGGNARKAFVFGNELDGVAEEVIAACDGAIVIPQYGTKHSLNVSVCAGIVVGWSLLRARSV